MNHLFDFGGEKMIAVGDTIECPAKKTYVLFSEIEKFIVDRKKRVIGVRGDTNQPCHIWGDGTYVHVGCLKELEHEFQKKFVELVKELKN